MPTTNARRHIIPTGDEASFTREVIFKQFGESIRDVVPVANILDRTQLVSDLTDAGVGPSATRPLTVHRADAPGLHRLEVTVDGTVWAPVSGPLRFATKTEADSWGTANVALLTTGDRCVAAGVEYQWQGAWRFVSLAMSGRLTAGGVVLDANVEKEVARVTLPAEAPAGKYLVQYSATTGAGSATAHLQRVYFAGTELTAYVTDYLNNVPAGADTSKSDALIATHTGGAAVVTLEVRVNSSGGACRYARLTVTYVGA
ncbi:hypothetical protein OR221_0868 [Microbacterium laevaniformans OR221]|nr:hypothetical protein OR221_0868 [Microbacterium laevaniformans OR221]